MSTKFKNYLVAGFLLVLGTSIKSQTVELPTFSGSFSPGGGPVTSAQGPISLRKDLIPTLNLFTPTLPAEATTVTMTLANQQYSGGMPYSNIQTGLVFGAEPTGATGGVSQQVDSRNIYAKLGDFIISPGGPTDNFYTAASTLTPGTGIVTGATFGLTEPNGAVFLFTNAQWQLDRTPGGSLHNSSTRYYYGDLVINFNRFIANPVIHIAGLGGSYRYLPVGAPNVAGNYLSTFFSTELEVVGRNLTKLSGNSFLTVSGSNITNNAAAPSGASVSTTGGLFDELGAASGSIRVNAAVKTVTIRVYLRGSNSSNFSWSAAGSLSGGTRNPLTGDIWGISVSAQLDQLIPLPSTGLVLNAALNGTNVNLNWKTQTELNSKEFEIERSVDGVNFSQIGTKQAAGNTTTETSYSHLDPNMNVNVYYYRVKLVDLDAKYGYSNIATVRKSDIRGVRVFQNPAISEMKLEFTNIKGAYTISLYNMNGQEVAKQTANISATTQYVSVNRNTLPTGTYSVRITNADNSEVYTDKVIFQ